MNRRFRIAACIVIFVEVIQQAPLGVTDDSHNSSLNALRLYLADFSVVTISDAKAGTRDVVKTRIDPIPDTADVSLTYERATYSGADDSTMRSRQIIHYTLKRPSLDKTSIHVQSSDRDGKLWLVTVGVLADAELIPYANLVESKKADGTAEVTSSHSRVREVAVGYCANQQQAMDLVYVFREWLREPENQAAPPLPFQPRKPTPLSRSSA